MVSEAFGKTFVDATLAPTTTGTTTNNLRFPGQYEDVETGTYYNFMRTYLPTVGRYGESDPIGLYAGLNTYTYVEGNPVSFIDPLGLWSIGFSSYRGWGGEIIFGVDKNTGGGFMTLRAGRGLGGGVKWDPNGTRPGSKPSECNDGGWGVGAYGDVQFNAGRFQASLQNNAGVNFNNRSGPSDYRQILQPMFSLGDSWGFRAEAAYGSEVTFFSPKDPMNRKQQCGCP
jgi:RHS repeat-associated protein